MPAYYNEHDPCAAQWLRNLIAAGHIAPGVVDERSIEDVRPRDLDGFTQCHFFAGIGVWSLALRRAGWGDDRPVWTGSCPCQPFSQAGAGAGFADERHLWPAFHHLIKECRPSIVFGEQVASKDAGPWIDLVHTDMEALGYAFGAVPFPASGVGAPHIRDRLYWVADASGERREWRQRPAHRRVGHGGDAGRIESHDGLARPGEAGLRLADTERYGGGSQAAPADHGQPQAVRPADWAGGRGGVLGGLADTGGERRQQDARSTPSDEDAHGVARWQQQQSNSNHKPASDEQIHGARSTGPVNGHWANADWLLCRDGKWRPVSPLPQPLVDGSSEGLGRVRSEVIAQVEEEVNAATAQSEGGRAAAMRGLLDYLGTEAKRSWAFGGIPGLHEAPFLLAFLRQLQEQGWSIAQGVALPRSEASSGLLRSLWHDQAASGASHRRELEEQRPGEPTDVVRVLSCLLARHASAAWGGAHAAHAEIGFPLGHNAPARVGRLRAYGNAINAEAARVFIESAIESLT